MSFDAKDEFMDLVKLRFTSICPTRHLKVYGVPKDSLKEYKSTNAKRSSYKFAFDNEPPSKYRMKEEEIQTQVEADAGRDIDEEEI